jgi:hypothetical protein
VNKRFLNIVKNDKFCIYIKLLKAQPQPSPDCSENPFFEKKDCNGKWEIASKNK